MYELDDKLLDLLLERCRRETGGEVRRWFVTAHIDGPGGKSTGALTLSVLYTTADKRGGDYWTHTLRKQDRP